jgi:uncharacterized protein (UPF0264 family)
VPPRLLISVVEPDEVEAALAGGADIIDVKNPAEGSLGAATPSVIAAVRARVPAGVALSVALGDAPLPGTMALAAAGASACGAVYVKLGLRGLARPDDAVVLLTAVREAVLGVRPQARVVAVAYADAGRAHGLPPAALPTVAARAGVQGVMIDTAFKEGVSTLDLMGADGVASFLASARALGLETALAGALSVKEVASCSRLDVDIVGVRGAACLGGRAGRVSAQKVHALRLALSLSAAESRALAPS